MSARFLIYTFAANEACGDDIADGGLCEHTTTAHAHIGFASSDASEMRGVSVDRTELLDLRGVIDEAIARVGR